MKSALSDRVVVEFHGVCNHAFGAWQLRRTLFDDNPRIAEFESEPTAPFFKWIGDITHDYILLQLAKLHDPAVQSGRCNLSLAFVIQYGGWDSETRQELERMVAELAKLAELIRPARNRIVSHFDLESILEGKPLGAFRENADQEYFKILEEFVNLVHDKTVGGPRPFCIMAKGDAGMFLTRFYRAAEAGESHGA